MKLAMAVLLLFGGIAQGQVLKGRIELPNLEGRVYEVK